MFFKDNTVEKGDDIREAFEKLAREAGCSGTFSVFDLDEPELGGAESADDLAVPQAPSYKAAPPAPAPALASSNERQPSARVPSAPQERTSAQQPAHAASVPAGDGDGADEGDPLLELGSDIDSLVSRDTHFKPAVVGGFEKNSVWRYVDEVDAAFADMQNNYERQFKDLSAECARIAAECALVHEQMDEAERKCRDSEAELSQKCESLDAMLQERNRLIETLERQVDDKDRALADQSATLNKATELESQLTAMEEAVERLTREKNESADQLSVLEETVDEMSAELKASSTNRDSLLAEIDAAKENAAEEQRKASAAAARCKDLESAAAAGELKLQELDDVKKSLEETLSMVDGMKGRVKSLEAENAGLLAKVEERDKVNAKARESALRLSDELDKAKADNRSVFEQLEAERKKNDGLAREAESLKDRTTEMEQENASLRSAVADLTAQRDEIFVKLSEANRSTEDLISDNRRLVAEVEGFIASRSKIAAVLGMGEDEQASDDASPEPAEECRAYAGSRQTGPLSDRAAASARAEAVLACMRNHDNGDLK